MTVNLNDPPLEYVAAGVAQIGVFAAGLAAIQYRGADLGSVSIAGVIVALWVVSSIASTLTYLVAGAWLAGPEVEGGDLT